MLEENIIYTSIVEITEKLAQSLKEVTSNLSVIRSFLITVREPEFS